MTNSQIIQNFEEYRRILLAENGLSNLNISEGERLKHKQLLEANIEDWIKFFFSASAKYPFAPFHKKFFKLSPTRNGMRY